ncbi:hypothetical protein DRV85_12350 [Rhodosalinus halophilus]|uniref:Uncharacterized protein n=1 Tax=Rhodosalinus halophilus TaxID=2259333 RepID=A0A365U6V1_9RHOB|nr:hypothetical protein [Rhodosalinus halophilus]RBI84231.1 hypothetical protein DRV85_12350 [Rhodosalinus halophilus]
MGLHDLESISLTEMNEDVLEKVERSQSLGWLDGLLGSYSSLPEVPLGTPVEVLKHLLGGMRGLYLSHARKVYMKQAERLLAVVEANKASPLAIFLEYVDQPDFETTLKTYTVWKGTLFETRVAGETVVCWHPDKDFRPADYKRIKHTRYSEVGRKQRRRAARRE